MRAKEAERRRAVQLRQAGWSVTRIAVELGVSKSSVSVWVRDVARPPKRPVAALSARPLPVWRDGRTRTCSRCRRLLPSVSFNRHGAGRQWWCRACFREYFRARGEAHVAHVGRNRAERRTAARALVRSARRIGCADCGELDPVVLEFDHLSSKRDDISALAVRGTSVARLEAELRGCDVVCVNCHRRRTARRAGWRRAHSAWRETLGDLLPQVRAAVELAFETLLARGCAECGERDLVVLDFDHVGHKRAAVMRLAWDGYAVQAVRAEIGRCDVVCATCHRRRTARRAERARSGS